jgi:Ran GTPase-activating protein (RanGAP) involved in mRNA processing and transport
MPLPLLNEKKAQNLTTLALEDYKVSSDQVEALAAVLGLFGPASISKVYLNSTGIQDKDMATLLDGVRGNSSITSVELANNQLQEYGTRALCALFEKPRTQLHSLRLSRAKVAERETELLCEAIGAYRGLRELRLDDFKLSDDACEHLAQGLLSNSNLSHLDLSWCQVSGSSLVTMTEALSENKTLTDVSLQHLACRREHCEQVAQNLHAFVKHNQCL